MNRSSRFIWLAIVYVTLAVNLAFAQDWPQWRGANRDARATGFTSPKEWPKELTKKWSANVGDGVATPSLVGNKLFVFAMKDGKETIYCLDATTGKEIWQDGYKMSGADGGARGFAGPRASPTVVDGKVITLGVRGTLSCLDANGDQPKVLWYNEDYADSWPMFYTSSSPIVVDSLCVAQLGGDRDGVVAAFDLNTGKEKWKWEGDGPAYASPVVLDMNGQKVIVAVTNRYLVALSTDGKELWKTSYSQGRYNAASPIISGDAIIIAGPSSGITAVKLVKKDDKFGTEELWKNRDNSVQFSTPVVRDGWLYGLSGLNSLFCLSTTSGSDKTAWNAPLGGSAETGRPRENQPQADRPRGDAPGTDRPREQAQDRGPGGRGGFGGGGRRGGGGGGRGYGSVVDAGSVLFALSPAGNLVVFEPNEKEFKQLASYKVAEGNTYAYPVVASNRIYIKDKDAVTLWTTE
jgi:outer membrane protein assembly factor BamB